MIISSTLRKAGPFIGNGINSVFPFPFKILNASDLYAVSWDPQTLERKILVFGTDYAVRLNDYQDQAPGGSLVTTNPLPNNHRLIITSNLPDVQGTQLTNLGGMYPETLNSVHDAMIIHVQELQEQLDRCAKVPLESDVSDVATLVSHITTLGSLDRDLQELSSISADIAILSQVAGDIPPLATVSDAIKVTADNVDSLSYFINLYQGAHGTAPEKRWDGSPIQPGDLYFNTAVSKIMVFTGTAWEPFTSAGGGGAAGEFVEKGGDTMTGTLSLPDLHIREVTPLGISFEQTASGTTNALGSITYHTPDGGNGASAIVFMVRNDHGALAPAMIITGGSRAIVNSIRLGTDDKNVTLAAPDSDATFGVTFTFPRNDGVIGQVLRTDGVGGTSWVNVPSTDILANYVLKAGDTMTGDLQAPALIGEALSAKSGTDERVRIHGTTGLVQFLHKDTETSGLLFDKPDGTPAFRFVSYQSADGTKNLQLIVGITPILTVSGSKNFIGIGTDDPQGKFHVNGPLVLGRPNGKLRIQLQAPQTQDDVQYVITLPRNLGSAGQALTTDGRGNLSWRTFSGGGGAAGDYVLKAGDTMTGGLTTEFLIAKTLSINGLRATKPYLTIETTDRLGADEEIGSIYFKGTLGNPAQGLVNFGEISSDTHGSMYFKLTSTGETVLELDPDFGILAGYGDNVSPYNRNGVTLHSYKGIAFGGSVNNASTVILQAPTVQGAQTQDKYTFPVGTGSVGQVLRTDGTGILSWTSQVGTEDFVSKAGDTMTGQLTVNAPVVTPDVLLNTSAGNTGGLIRFIGNFVGNSDTRIGTVDFVYYEDGMGQGYAAAANMRAFKQSNGGCNIELLLSSSSGSQLSKRFLFGKDGRFGINISDDPSYTLDVNGDIGLRAGASKWLVFAANTGQSATNRYVFPSTMGTSGQFLRSDGAGNLTWATPSGDGGGGTAHVLKAGDTMTGTLSLPSVHTLTAIFGDVDTSVGAEIEFRQNLTHLGFGEVFGITKFTVVEQTSNMREAARVFVTEDSQNNFTYTIMPYSRTLDAGGTPKLFTFSGAGRLGILTSTPEYELDVVGKIAMRPTANSNAEVTLAPNPTATAPSNYVMPPSVGESWQVLGTTGNGNLAWVAGSNAVDVQEFTATGNGTWVKPSTGKLVRVQLWGGGGGAGAGFDATSKSGGGGGGYNERIYTFASLPANVALFVATGGAGGSEATQVTGSAGGTSRFGTVGESYTIYAYGGGGGDGTINQGEPGVLYGGMGGGPMSAGDSATSKLVVTDYYQGGPQLIPMSFFPASLTGRGDILLCPVQSPYHGGNGEGLFSLNKRFRSTDSIWGGGGGISAQDSLQSRAGTSVYGGAGGSHGNAGSQPGGGGGASIADHGVGGRGGHGKIIVTTW